MSAFSTVGDVFTEPEVAAPPPVHVESPEAWMLHV